MSLPEAPPGAPRYVLPDKEQEMSIEQQFAGARRNRILDKFAIMIHLLDRTLRWTHTNLQNNNILMRILQARVWTDITDATYRPIWDNNSTELTDSERRDLRDGFIRSNQIMLNVTEHYAELRIVAKGFRPKQIERILTGESRTEKELDKIFQDKGKNT